MLRGLLLGGRLEIGAAEAARHDHFSFAIIRHEIEPLADRIWTLRPRYTCHDAAYLALAEGLSVPLYTCDAKLAGGGHHADVRVAPASR